jgi:small conductance mechanosensitive channel
MDGLYEWFDSIEVADVMAWSWQVLAAILIFIIGRWVAKVLIRMLRGQMNRRDMDELLVNFVGNILYAVLLLAVVLVAVGHLGIPVTPLVAILGGLALAVRPGFAELAEQFCLGHHDHCFPPFHARQFRRSRWRVGRGPEGRHFPDRTEDPGQPARHRAQQLDYLQPDHQLLGLRNPPSRPDHRRPLRRRPEARPRHDEKVLEAHEKVLDDPAPTIMVMELGDSSVDFAVRPWVNASDFWPVRGELLEQLKVELEEAGCSIPFPQRDIHVFNEK